MRTTTLFLFFFIFLANAQNKQFYYNFIITNDSASKVKPLDELTTLIVSPKGSLYYSHDAIAYDSAFSSELQKISENNTSNNIKLNLEGIKVGRLKSVVKKDYPNYKTTFTNKIGSRTYRYEEKRPLKWEILSEKKTIGEWPVQKATTEYLGRKWIAWFSTEIPIQDGPYKFHGLPGLIVSIEDADHDYQFVLNGIKNNVSIKKIDDVNAINLTYEKYKTQYIESIVDPNKEIRQQMISSRNSGDIHIYKDVNGNNVSFEEYMKIFDNRKPNNPLAKLNPIEKDLLK